MYQEEQSFNLRFSLEARFPDEYEGEDDESAWLAQWEAQVKPDIVKSIFRALEQYPDWVARFRNRGMAATDEIEIVLQKTYTDPSRN
ncbi:MAG: hypothetical protein CO149_05790 [Nitrospirae bacterium CG_4_9_14_3_um_filter_51_5]|nr:MAG: hypothetical protein CO149_05790 [Nitrospirae bacterium CG_4_9_14_3_um_filter_51_5]